MGHITRNDNQIHISGDFAETELQVCIAAIHNTLISGETRSLILNFEKTDKVLAPNILPLCAHARQLLHQGYDTFLTLPENPELNRLFRNTGWAHLMDPIQFPDQGKVRGAHSPALIYKNGKEQYEAVNRAVDIILGSSKGLERGNLAALEWAINEITDNVLNHAESEIGGIFQVTTRRNGTWVELVVCDVGAGIPRTLRSAHKEISTDLNALEYAIQEGGTRNSQTNQGNGLFGSSRIAELSGGQFRIQSGYATLKLDKTKGLHIRKNNVPYNGTLIACSINFEDSKLLEEALYFKGKKYTPSYTYFDRLGEMDVLKISIKDEATSFGNRENARPIRLKIFNILMNSTKNMRISMEDVALISSSFADEVFGKLSSEIGHQVFSGRVRVVDTNPTVSGLIARAIEQRRKQDSDKSQDGA